MIVMKKVLFVKLWCKYFMCYGTWMVGASLFLNTVGSVGTPGPHYQFTLDSNVRVHQAVPRGNCTYTGIGWVKSHGIGLYEVRISVQPSKVKEKKNLQVR